MHRYGGLQRNAAIGHFEVFKSFEVEVQGERIGPSIRRFDDCLADTKWTVNGNDRAAHFDGDCYLIFVTLRSHLEQGIVRSFGTARDQESGSNDNQMFLHWSSLRHTDFGASSDQVRR